MTIGFNKVIGQTEMISSLKAIIGRNKVSHIYAFLGRQGIGKRFIANIFASMLLCDNPLTESACGHCKPCLLFDNGSNPDFISIGGKAESIGIEEARALPKDCIIKPLYSKRKVYLINNADRMTIPAQNCLLKTLEEPPDYVIILMTISNYECILETIRSRIISFNLKKNSTDEICAFIKEQYGKVNGIEFIANYSDGRIGAAIGAVENDDLVMLRDKILDTFVSLPKSSIETKNAYDFLFENKTRINMVLDILVLLHRDILTLKTAKTEKYIINVDKKNEIINRANEISVDRIIKDIQIIENTRKNLKLNANFYISVEAMIMALKEE